MAETQHAVTERGSVLDKYTEGDVTLALRLLVLNGGDVKRTVGALADEAIVITHAALRYWRDVAFARRYSELRLELSRDIGEDVAGRAMERALEADEAQHLYIQAATEKVDEVSPDRLAAAARDLAKAKSENIGNAQLLRGSPTEIRETRDTSELLDFLAKQGVLERDPRTIESEAVEIEE